MNNKLKHGEITEKIIGAALEVHRFLGNGFQEVIYQRALALELARVGLSFAREVEQDIFYKECPEPIGTRRADFVVEGKVLVELKAITAWEDVHITQVLNYLRAYRMEVALLINFGAKSLKFKRWCLHIRPSIRQNEADCIEDVIDGSNLIREIRLISENPRFRQSPTTDHQASG